MLNRIARIVIAVFGAGVGPLLVVGVTRFLKAMRIFDFDEQFLPLGQLAIYVASAILTGIIFYLLSTAIIKIFVNAATFAEKKFTEIPTSDIIYGTVGITAGLLIAFLLSGPVRTITIPWLTSALTVVIYVFLGYLGCVLMLKRRSDVFAVISPKKNREKTVRPERGLTPMPKILDTSVIIDGRIFDICQTGVVEGVIVIPTFVLHELQHIADSADSLKRNRGRRGLDILSRIQQELDVPVRVEDKDYDDIDQVDAKLIRLAKEIDGVVVTNDFNLNKVASVQKVKVLNINDLANAIKPVVLPGEEMEVVIVKDGKEAQQGVAYLDDGTMIVVDGGKRHMNEQLTVIVTSVLQTSAGRMIFAKLRSAV